ncbi:CHD5-like protein-domain-containing protein [Limtongia smithiae]|uniref:CHD5-like protein-domain-containing protein n=1 Tax=Limtongia smithiae TaxID=1125753 RepID=UPI0034CEA2A2
MVDVILIVIGVVLINAIIAAVGKENISELAWYLWSTYVPGKASRAIQELQKTQRETLAVNTEKTNTSAQDEFAKWAKLNRKVEKLTEQLEQLNSDISKQSTSFKKLVKRLLWVCTSGMKFGVRIKYRKAAMFWLPPGMFPSWAERILSLTSAPRGSVSVAVWFMVVDYAIKDAVVFALTKGVVLIAGLRRKPVRASTVNEKTKKPTKKVQ